MQDLVQKKFFIGHPAFIIMIMAWYRKWPAAIFFILSIVATIGQGSMVENFCTYAYAGIYVINERL